MLPLNETTISSLDLTAITPLTPRREKNKDKNDNNSGNNNKSNNYKNESRHCQRRQLHCRGCGAGEGDCVNAFDGSGDERNLRKANEPARLTVCAATSPIKFDCDSSGFKDLFKLGERTDSDRNSYDCRFKKKEKMSDFVDFIELLSE